jgi:hypothetical protein
MYDKAFGHREKDTSSSQVQPCGFQPRVQGGGIIMVVERTGYANMSMLHQILQRLVHGEADTEQLKLSLWMTKM